MRFLLPVLVATAALALGWNLDGYRLLDPDEGRNAEVAREMSVTHDYVVPHLDGLPYLDKPIVYFAAAAVLMQAFGPSEAMARLPAYIATLAIIALLVWFARRRWGETAGWLAGLAFATMPLTLAYAHTAIFDSTLALCITAAMICFFEERTTLAWAAIGAGAITKGPVAIFVPLVAVIPFALATGRPLRRLVSWRAGAAFAVVALPWFLAATSRLPEFPHYAFVVETFQRFTTTTFHRTAPVWYYLPILPVAAFPWVVPALAGLKRWREVWAARREPRAREAIWLACWVLGPLVLFTLNRSKLPQYVLPLLPAFALAAAHALATQGPRVAWRSYTVLTTLAGVAFVAAPGRLVGGLPLTTAERATIPAAALILGASLLASAAGVALAAWRGWTQIAALAYAIVVIKLPFYTIDLMRAVGEDRSSARLADAIRPALTSGPVQVLGVAAYPPSLPFYLGRPIAVATASAVELTSNYIIAYQNRYRTLADSPLRPASEWQTVLAACTTPTVFVVRSDDRVARGELSELPLLGDDGHYAAYGPCASPSPHRGEGAGG